MELQAQVLLAFAAKWYHRGSCVRGNFLLYPGRMQEMIEERDQLWTLLLESYEEVARAGRFIHANSEESNELSPNLIGEANRLLAEDK